MDEIEFWNKYLYTDQKTILAELELRKNDSLLKKRVEDFWGELSPSFLRNQELMGFFARPIITPNMETRFFIDIAKDFNVTPLFMEFPDKFTTVNKSKYHLAKPHFFFTSRKGTRAVERNGLVDFNKWEGKPLADVETFNGKKLKEVHNELFSEAFPEHKENLVDISLWFDAARNGYDDYYYIGFLALGICHGVIFENFMLDDDRERDFFIKKVAPSFKKIEELFGVKPLISPVLPIATAKLDEWYHYPKI